MLVSRSVELGALHFCCSTLVECVRCSCLLPGLSRRLDDRRSSKTIATTNAPTATFHALLLPQMSPSCGGPTRRNPEAYSSYRCPGRESEVGHAREAGVVNADGDDVTTEEKEVLRREATELSSSCAERNPLREYPHVL